MIPYFLNYMLKKVLGMKILNISENASSNILSEQ